MTMQLVLAMVPASLRSACDIRRACRPTKAVAHLALDLRAGHQRGDGVHDDHVDRAGAHERVGDLQRLLAGVRLGDEHGSSMSTPRARGIDGVERVLRVDEGDLAARASGPPPGRAGPASSYRRTPGRRSRRCGPWARRRCRARASSASEPVGMASTFIVRLVAQTHDGALAVVLFDLCHRRFRWRASCRRCGAAGRRLSRLSLLPLVHPPVSASVS